MASMKTSRHTPVAPFAGLVSVTLGRELTGVPVDARTARFRTVAVAAWPDGREIAVEGVCDGTIAEAELGSRGFGYDPVFIPADGDGRSFSQMSEAEKHEISHRGRAFRALVAALASSPPA